MGMIILTIVATIVVILLFLKKPMLSCLMGFMITLFLLIWFFYTGLM